MPSPWSSNVRRFMPVYWLTDNPSSFPHPSLATQEGIIAIGGDLSPNRLLHAYSMGIFPWFNPGDPIIWWSPDPRFVLYPNDLKVSKSMRPYFNQRKFQLTYDRRFLEVIQACKIAKRGRKHGGSWITDTMVEAYCELHRLGYAHSVEVWQKEELVGGLYGVSLGKCFFGESMFTKMNNASKFGFISLVQQLQALDFQLIDCQQETKHLASLGAQPIPRKDFLQFLIQNSDEPSIVGDWNKIFN